MSSYDLHPKLFLPNGTIKTTGTSANLTAGDLGLYDVFTNQVVTVANAATHPLAYIAQGSYYPSDKLGVHGGYKESIKSPAFTKGINPKLVKRWYKVAPQAGVNQTIRLFWDGAAATGPGFLCGKTYYLRLEVKGEPVLRMMNRYAYKHLPAYTGCCGNDCTAPCTAEVVDAATVMYQWALGVNNDPILSKFVLATAFYKVAATTLNITSASTAATAASATGIAVGQKVIGVGIAPGTLVAAVAGTAVTLSIAATATNAAAPVTFSTIVDGTYVSPVLAADKALVVAGIEITVIYSETVFNDCSFNQGDYYNDKFVEMLASLVYQNGDVCETGEVVMNSSTGAGFTEVTPFQTEGGSGEKVLRDFIASQLSSGIFFSQNPRDRETTNNVALTTVQRSATYTRYYLIYSLGITGNPSNALSHDQYILCFAVKTGINATAFEALFLAWLQAFNPTLALETVA